MKKITFHPKNFALQNTPSFMQKIGNFGLVSALIGVSILAIPDTLSDEGFELILPHIVILIAKGLIGLGSLAKMVTKLFGEIETTLNGTK